MMVARADQRATFDEDAAVMRLEPLTLAEARDWVPVLKVATVAHVAAAQHAWDIDTDLLLQGFAREARGNGAQILTSARCRASPAPQAGGMSPPGRIRWRGASS